MKNIKFILLAGISLLISNISFAQGTDNSCSGDKWTDIYYVNGVWVEKEDARKVVKKK